MNIIATLAAFASLATLWLLVRGVLQVRRHRLGLLRAGAPPRAHFLNEILYLGIFAVAFGVALAVTVWAMR